MIVDSAKLGAVRQAPGGGVVVSARIGRSGVQVYRRLDGSAVRAYRPADEVKVADYSGAPITVGHPPEGVSPDNWREVSVGVVRGQAPRTERIGRHEFAVADLQIADGRAIGKIGKDLVECSCAYTTDKDWTPGITTDGEAYDVVFRGLKPNHVALGGLGFARAGRDARLIADGESAEDQFMSDVLIADGIDAQAPTSPATPADRDKLIADAALAQARYDGLVKDHDRVKAELDVAKGKLVTLQAQVDGLPKAIQDGVAAVLTFRAKVAPVLGAEYTFDGKTEREVKIDAIKKLVPNKVITDAQSDVYLDAFLDAVNDGAVKQHDHNLTTDGTSIEPKRNGIQEKTKAAYFGGKA